MMCHFDYTDEDFLKNFSNFTLPPAVFTHEAHLRLAWLNIHKYGKQHAIEITCSQIKEYAAYFNIDKYNETVTIAAVCIIFKLSIDSEFKEFSLFIEGNQNLLKNFKVLIQMHYSIDIFNDLKARKIFIEPDLMPF